MEEITALAKRRGFIFQSSEIYGGINGAWDYGPVGAELKRNVRDAWWRDVVELRDDVVGVDTSILMSPEVWRASGHLEHFHDLMVDCRTCKKRFRADQIKGDRCPSCGNATLTEPREFHMMFKTSIGAMEDAASIAYLAARDGAGYFCRFQTRVSNRAQEAALRRGADRQGVSQRNHAGQLYFSIARVRADGT